MSLLADAQDFVRMEREVPTGVSLALSDGRVGVGGGIRSINRTTKGLPPPARWACHPASKCQD